MQSETHTQKNEPDHYFVLFRTITHRVINKVDRQTLTVEKMSDFIHICRMLNRCLNWHAILGYYWVLGKCLALLTLSEQKNERKNNISILVFCFIGRSNDTHQKSVSGRSPRIHTTTRHVYFNCILTLNKDDNNDEHRIFNMTLFLYHISQTRNRFFLTSLACLSLSLILSPVVLIHSDCSALVIARLCTIFVV